MTIIYYDCFAGISGDMNLGAMINLGVPVDYLISELKKLNVDGYTLDAQKSLKMGITGIKVDVMLQSDKPKFTIDTNAGHSHGHSHKHTHEHAHAHIHHSGSDTEHSHRSYNDIRLIIDQSSLAAEVKKTSIDIFDKVAVAEAKIHDKPIGEVHFHEVGAVDSIVDIVGAAICYHFLKPDKVLCSTIELGGGFVNCAHGKFPVPAPATIEILKGIPVKLGTVQFETTTPTGAAILATLVDEFTDTPVFNVQKTAYGIGHRNMEIPNVLRVHQATSSVNTDTEKAVIIECNIDDMQPELYEFLLEKLLLAGAQDVFLTPIIMKKSRPATKISVLCTPEKQAEMEAIILSESTTLGVRSFPVVKNMLQRRSQTVLTKYGSIDVKIAFSDTIEMKVKPEYEQCKDAAIKFNATLKQVVDEVLQTIKRTNNG